MKYMMLIYADRAGFEQLTAEEQAASLEPWMAYTDAMQRAGVMLAGDALVPTSAATSVRVRDGKDLVTDGPFAETKETLGGFYVLDVPSVDEAVDWAKRCPGAQYGTIELRPVMVFE